MLQVQDDELHVSILIGGYYYRWWAAVTKLRQPWPSPDVPTPSFFFFDGLPISFFFSFLFTASSIQPMAMMQ